MCRSPFAYGGPSCSVNVGCGWRSFCHLYRSSVHRLMYSGRSDNFGLGGKVALGRCKVLFQEGLGPSMPHRCRGIQPAMFVALELSHHHRQSLSFELRLK